MDPPSYGRGPGGEVWKLEEQVYTLVEEAAKLLHEDSLFFLLNSYTTGLSASVMEYILGVVIRDRIGGHGFVGRDRPAGQEHRLCASLRQHSHLAALTDCGIF